MGCRYDKSFVFIHCPRELSNYVTILIVESWVCLFDLELRNNRMDGKLSVISIQVVLTAKPAAKLEPGLVSPVRFNHLLFGPLTNSLVCNHTQLSSNIISKTDCARLGLGTRPQHI